jgi:secreted PhoX family phosphatase
MAGPAEGFSSYTLFANEESDDDLAVPVGAPYGPDPALAPKREAGYVVAYDTASGEYRQITRMGRHNHENSVVVPGGWTKVAILSGDDTFNAPSSQLYLFTANDEEAVRNDHGQLWAFQATGTEGSPPVDPYDPFNGANDYGDIAVGESLSGRFIHVPTDIARGLTDVAPQKALEDWSNANNVFQFIRVEDIAYDRNDPTVVYFADTGERRATPDASTGRLRRGPNLNLDGSQFRGPYPNGRIFRMELNANDPRIVDSLSIVLDADAGGYDNPAVMHQPDNLDTSETTLMVQEDSGQAPNSRIWAYHLATGDWSVVAHVNDPDWESSGIVDASEWFGPDTWLLDVQAHRDFVDEEMEGSVRVKREAGQLLLLEIPGTAPNP